jgi:hypothetical protein
MARTDRSVATTPVIWENLSSQSCFSSHNKQPPFPTINARPSISPGTERDVTIKMFPFMKGEE